MSAALGHWSDPEGIGKEHNMGVVEKEINLEPIPPSRLPEGCQLRRLYDAQELARDELNRLGNLLLRYQNEHLEVTSWLAVATIDGVTPEQFATETARQVLLARTVDQTGDKVRAAENRFFGARGDLDDAYGQYRIWLRAIKARRKDGEAEGPSLDREQVEALKRQVERAISPA